MMRFRNWRGTARRAGGWLLAGLAMVLGGAASAADAAWPKGISLENYLNWEGSLVIESDIAETRLVVVPGIGGRIMRYEVMGKNILWDNPVAHGLTVAVSKRVLQAGGHQAYIVSETTALPSLERLEYGPHGVAGTKDFTLTLASETNAETGLRLEKEIILDPESGEVGLNHRLKNTSARDLSCALRSRTQCLGGGYVLLPLAKVSRFRLGWNLAHQIEGKLLFDSLNPSSTAVKILNNVLVAETGGPPAKIGADSDAEWVAYAHDRHLFIQYFPHDFRLQYPDGGNTVEVSWNENYTELEICGAESVLAPGATLAAPSKWTMIELKERVTSAKQARALVSKIPPSPFKAPRK